MANVKITDLTAYTDAVSTDVLAIVDVSNNVTKKISISDLLKATPLGTAALPAIAIDGDPNTGIYSPGADQLAVSTGGTGRLFIDSSGRLLVGTSASFSQAGLTPRLQVEETTAGLAGIRAHLNSDNTFGGYLALSKSRGASLGSNTSVQSNDVLGTIYFFGADGTDKDAWGAQIDCVVDGTPGANDMPGRLVFSTTADGAANPTERMRISSDGTVGIGQASDAAGYRLNIYNPSADFCGVSIGNNVSGNGSLNGLVIAENQGDALFINRENGYMAFSTNNTERVRLDSSGRLLVGTSSDSGGALLQVNDDRIRVGTAKTPASATATGAAGEICWDANYIYVCTAANTWKRAALSTW